MEERSYQVQEAVRLIGVESHVLRYWEEELGITVGRTSRAIVFIRRKISGCSGR